MEYSQEQVKLWKMAKEILSTRIDQLESENRALQMIVVLHAQTERFNVLKDKIEAENPGMKLNADFMLVPKESE